MMNIGKRMGWLAACLAALAVSIMLQFIGSIVGIVIYAVPEVMELAMQGITDEAAIMSVTANSAMDAMGLCLVLAHALMILCFAIWYYFGCGRPKLRNVGKTLAPKHLLVILLVCGGMCFFTNFGLPVASLVIPESIMTAYEELMEQAGFGVDAMAIFASVCLAPFGEELLCRGVIFHYAGKMVEDLENRRKAIWNANTIQAVLFGVLHGNIIQGSYAFLMGLALGYLVQRYHSLLPAILGHMLINAASTYVWEPIANVVPESYVVYAICTVLCLAVAFAGLYLGGPAVKAEADMDSDA